MLKEDLLKRIKSTVALSDPGARVILYGSFARNSEKEGSDIDLLILLNKSAVSREDETKIKYPLYEIEFETGQIISPLVLTASDWETRHRITPFYQNIQKEGRIL